MRGARNLLWGVLDYRPQCLAMVAAFCGRSHEAQQAFQHLMALFVAALR